MNSVQRRKARNFYHKFKVLIYLFVILLALVLIQNKYRPNQQIEALPELTESPVIISNELVYLIPNPCALNSVICDYEKDKRIVQVSAYTSTVGQTDESPCISADGSNICQLHQEGEQICASNFVPFGTEVHIENFGTCIVRDRMNRRYSDRVDVYFGEGDLAYNKAINFGVQTKIITY